MDVSTFLFSNFEPAIIGELRDAFKKLRFKIKNGNTASFQLPSDENIKAYFSRGRNTGQFWSQLDNLVKCVWSTNFINGKLEQESFQNGSTSFTYENCDQFHRLYIKGENLASNEYNITLACTDKDQSSLCTIS
jgi:hypothetical protein